MYKFRYLLLSFLLISLSASAQSFDYENVCLNASEQKLAKLINDFRKANRKGSLPLSKALSIVAKTHVADLQNNNPDTSICLTASWSNKGKWTACCYNKYILKEDCMWDKPKELTKYPYRGYELSYFEEGIIQVDSLFSIWMSSEETKDMLLTNGNHATKKWETMGLAVGENYACVWFGQRADAAGSPPGCETLKTAEIATAENADNSKPQKYYLIYGSFTLESDAKEAVKRFNNSGFK
ncbi:MAG: hypothetical protein K8F24_01300, partial [Bacteroidales bacterium]|nr:hypothetical protein [Bacteroidales bacterium]